MTKGPKVPIRGARMIHPWGNMIHGRIMYPKEGLEGVTG